MISKEANERKTAIWSDGTLEVEVKSLEELDKINRVLVTVENDVWCNFFYLDDEED